MNSSSISGVGGGEMGGKAVDGSSSAREMDMALFLEAADERAKGFLRMQQREGGEGNGV